MVLLCSHYMLLCHCLTNHVTIDRPKTKKKKLSQCHPKRLQKEDTDHVWNELAFFKNQAKNLTMDKYVPPFVCPSLLSGFIASGLLINCSSPTYTQVLHSFPLISIASFLLPPFFFLFSAFLTSLLIQSSHLNCGPPLFLQP